MSVKIDGGFNIDVLGAGVPVVTVVGREAPYKLLGRELDLTRHVVDLGRR
jgi:hypothetical protein